MLRASARSDSLRQAQGLHNPNTSILVVVVDIRCGIALPDTGHPKSSTPAQACNSLTGILSGLSSTSKASRLGSAVRALGAKTSIGKFIALYDGNAATLIAGWAHTIYRILRFSWRRGALTSLAYPFTRGPSVRYTGTASLGGEISAERIADPCWIDFRLRFFAVKCPVLQCALFRDTFSPLTRV